MVTYYKPVYGKVTHSITGLASFINFILICIEVFSKRSAECRQIWDTDNFAGIFLFFYALMTIFLVALFLFCLIGYYVTSGERPIFIR